jgi:hypothetical protein
MLRHEILLLLMQRLETINPHAAGQFWQDYAGLTVTLASARAWGLDGRKIAELADLCLAQLRQQKIVANKRDQVAAPEALRRLALLQYDRMLPAIRKTQRATKLLPRAERETRMCEHINKLLSWMGPEGRRRSPAPPTLLRGAYSHAAREVAKEIVEHVYKGQGIKIDSLLRVAPRYRANLLFRWLEKEVSPIS